MSETGLFDAPTAATRRWLAVFNVVGTVLVALLLAFAVYKLSEANQFRARLWLPFLEPGLWRTIGEGFAATLRAAFWCVLLSLVFGTVLGIARMSSRRWISLPVGVWVEFNRAIPSLLVILLLYLTCSRWFGEIGAVLHANSWGWLSWLLGFRQLGTLAPLVIAVVIHHAAIVAEVVRSGILAIPRGQSDAGLSLGLSCRKVLLLILLPQAIRGMLPALISECVRSLKATALGYAIGYMELLRTGQIIAAALHNAIPVSIMLTIFYVGMCLPLTWYAEHIDRRSRRRQANATTAEVAAEPPITLAPVGAIAGGRP